MATSSRAFSSFAELGLTLITTVGALLPLLNLGDTINCNLSIGNTRSLFDSSGVT